MVKQTLLEETVCSYTRILIYYVWNHIVWELYTLPKSLVTMPSSPPLSHIVINAIITITITYCDNDNNRIATSSSVDKEAYIKRSQSDKDLITSESPIWKPPIMINTRKNMCSYTMKQKIMRFRYKDHNSFHMLLLTWKQKQLVQQTCFHRQQNQCRHLYH